MTYPARILTVKPRVGWEGKIEKDPRLGGTAMYVYHFRINLQLTDYMACACASVAIDKYDPAWDKVYAQKLKEWNADMNNGSVHLMCPKCRTWMALFSAAIARGGI